MHYHISTHTIPWNAIRERANNLSTYQQFCDFIEDMDSFSDEELFALSVGDIPFPPGKVCMSAAWASHSQCNSVGNFAAAKRMEREDPNREKVELHFMD